jgi:acetyltransferase-like isoleucine patch superfamily enzyme
VWQTHGLGTCSVVLDGIAIGEGVAVGAASVVTKDIGDHSIALGVLAKVVRDRATIPVELIKYF